MGLSAWKQYRQSRWALRVNPSSGNLHPTEAYVIRDGHVSHYAPREHALERRAMLETSAWTSLGPGFLVALTSIHWREAWKYGERAFRYCQHDAGHAIGALRMAAALLGWKLTLLPRWSDEQLAAVLGLDRDADFVGVEREEPECIAVVTPADVSPWIDADPAALVDAARHASWRGVANQLSGGHVEWPIIDEVAKATRYGGAGGAGMAGRASEARSNVSVTRLPPPALPASPALGARRIILQRRSAVAFDGRSTLSRETFVSMLAWLQPHAPPWDAIHWSPHIHLLLFVHRVDGVTPGVYAYPRDPVVAEEWRAAMRPEFLWEDAGDGLSLLIPTDVTWVANRASCDQDIAADGFFSLGMIARLESSVRARGPWFYRRLFWESGLLGQVLYLEAEAAGARSTGIGCFYDDAVHDMAGLSGQEWQSVYHFSMGMPVDDDRLTTETGYEWERT